MDISAYTHRGMVRPINEDACLVIAPWQEPALSSHCCAFAVADGMGGHAAGEVASHLAVTTAREWLTRRGVQPALTEDHVKELFQEANASVWRKSQENPDLSGMGTTLSMLLVNGRSAFLGHVGDSRVYRLRDARLEQLTHDHTLVAEQVRLGNLSPEDARKHPARNILSRAMGSREFITIDVVPLDIQSGDVFLICSDGIYGMITDDEILAILLRSGVSGAAKPLVEAANRAGGKDNSTCVIVELDQFPVPPIGKFSVQRLLGWVKSWGTVSTG